MNRRTFFQTLAAWGAAMLAPKLPPPAEGAVEEFQYFWTIDNNSDCVPIVDIDYSIPRGATIKSATFTAKDAVGTYDAIETDITVIVQEIVDRAGWVSGRPIYLSEDVF